MIGNTIKIYCGIIITFFSLQVFADESIHITVQTSEKAAAAIGFSVEGKNLGTMGKKYTGSGIKNKAHVFGYRKNSINGNNIYCGSMVLSQDANITLVMQGDKCITVIN